VIVTLTVAPSSRCTADGHELTHKGNINQIIATRDREIYQFNVALLAAVIARCRHLGVDTHRIKFASKVSQCVHEMIVTTNRTYMFLAGEDKITERINTHVAGIQSADFGEKAS